MTENQWLKHPTGLIPKGTVCPCCARYNSRDVVGHALVIKANQVLMVLRANQPMSGYWAIPGGYIDWDESMTDCVQRELKEETGLIATDFSLFGVYADPKRDQDGRQNVGVVYVVTQTAGKEIKSSEEVTEIDWFGFDALPEKIAFDHRQIIEDYIASLS